MNRSQLIAKLASQFSYLSSNDTGVSVAIILNAIIFALSRGERVEVRNFGVFSLNLVKARVGRNPRTGEAVKVPAKFKPYFKPGINLKKRVDASFRVYLTQIIR